MKSHNDICNQFDHALLVLRQANDDLLDLAQKRAVLALNLAEQKDATKIREEVARMEKHYIGIARSLQRIAKRERRNSAADRRRAAGNRPPDFSGKIYRGELEATDADGVTTMTDLQ